MEKTTVKLSVLAKSQRVPTFASSLNPKSGNQSPELDLRQTLSSRRDSRRRIRNLSLIKRKLAQSGQRSRPQTPLLKWKVEERVDGEGEGDEDEKKSESENGGKDLRRMSRERDVNVSARKLAAGFWRFQKPEVSADGGGRGLRRTKEQGIGFQPVAGHVRVPILRHHNNNILSNETRDLLQSQPSTSGMRNGVLCKLEPFFQFSNSVMEGATKWDPIGSKISDERGHIYNQTELLDQQMSLVSVICALQAELKQARVHILELETERHVSKKKLKSFLRKVDKEKTAWRMREHEKIRVFIESIRTELNHERKNRRGAEHFNSKLVHELADAKSLVKQLMQDYEEERKERVLIEQVCEELAKEIGDDKAEIEASKRESAKLREEAEEERKMLQLAEVWREERVQMKLVDAKVAVEEKYSQMNRLVSDLENFLRSRGAISDIKEMREAILLGQAASAVNVQDIKQLSYQPSKPDDIFSILEGLNFDENQEKEVNPYGSYSPATEIPKAGTTSPDLTVDAAKRVDGTLMASHACIDQNGDIDDESGWETVSQVEDQDSSYSLEGCTIPPAANKNCKKSSISGSGSGTDWETTINISEVYSELVKKSKKVSNLTKRLWKSGHNNGRGDIKTIPVKESNGIASSPEAESGNGGSSPDFIGRWSSFDLSDARIARQRKVQINVKESQKLQLRHALKQKI
ncbi:uncharacterized protein LOC111785415 [Cucurbita pepo subsp. pepo]|uniref:uncharacterized protein LOC111785415 n=1 Tax=Cucurbita pepo subsp. pepo TaxID=3664 RepID=UPI000C9D9501|nr:uncharacterized protein LOC111785415 [Cucurbita pepo subsp. pepo]